MLKILWKIFWKLRLQLNSLKLHIIIIKLHHEILFITKKVLHFSLQLKILIKTLYFHITLYVKVSTNSHHSSIYEWIYFYRPSSIIRALWYIYIVNSRFEQIRRYKHTLNSNLLNRANIYFRFYGYPCL